MCITTCTDAPFCADESGQPQLVGVKKDDVSVRVVCRLRADPVDDRTQFEWIVWPGAVAALQPPSHQSSRGVPAAGSYVTTANAGSRNNTAGAGHHDSVVGELVLPVSKREADGTTASSVKPTPLDSVSCRASNAVGRQQTPCLYHIIPACEYTAGCERFAVPSDPSPGSPRKSSRYIFF